MHALQTTKDRVQRLQATDHRLHKTVYLRRLRPCRLKSQDFTRLNRVGIVASFYATEPAKPSKNTRHGIIAPVAARRRITITG